MKKITKILLLLLVTFSSFFSVVGNVEAAPSKVKTSGSPTLLNGYVAGTKFYMIPLNNGTYTYCLNIHKKVPRSQTMVLTKELDAGIAYLMENGYPNKKITGNSKKDYYITQTAVWWYLDKTKGASNLSSAFKSSGSDEYKLRGHIKNLVTNAVAAKKRGYSSPTLSMSATSPELELTADKKYYESKDIVVSGSLLSSDVTLSLQDSGVGAELIDSNGSRKSSFKAGEKYRVRIPATSVKGTTNINILASASGTINKAYEYRPTNNELQNVSILYPASIPVQASVTVKASPSIVNIIKIDEKTKKPLEGALLVLKNAEGKIITSWNSTTNAHQIKNLPNGTYTLQETKAPKGYKLNKEEMTFTITNENRNITVKMENTPKTNVVNILKIDKSTGKPLKGAVLVVKDSKDNIVARFTTREEEYVLQDLEDGEYTVEEESAPNGYEKNEEKIKFVIDEEHTSHQITFENYPETVVPFTSSTTIAYVLGSIILVIGVGFVYYTKKKNA